MFDFPNAPTNGQTATAPNGVAYVWDGTAWRPVGVPLPAYAPLASPTFTGDPKAPTATAGDNDTSIATTAFVQQAVAPAADNVGRNLLHNALFNVAQRGAGPFTASVTYTLDRWQIYAVLDTVSVSQVAFGVGTLFDESAAFALGNTFTGNAGATAYTTVFQSIEDVRRLSSKTVTVSFYASTPSGALKLGVSLTQNFGTGGSPSANVAVVGQSVTLSSTYTRYSLTFTIPSISGKTLGTNNNHCTQLFFWYSAGANQSAMSGSVPVQSGTVYIWGVQLEVGAQATPLDYGGSPQQQLAQCQRFYQVGQCVTNSYSTAGLGAGQTYPLPVMMRASPTIAITNNANANLGSFATNVLQGGAAIWFNGTVTATGGWTINVVFTASADL